ncbi:MAG TPA: rhomboid family intramembrane serine protease [Solirubrobacteraceae bacterium]|nr:rhomboid family intramembrane serine protease [Solirubrobacteraceae bacterium]
MSPYITECPYCGHRLRRRAPKLPRAHAPSRSGSSRPGISSLLRRSPREGAPAGTSRRRVGSSSRWEDTRPYATIGLVAIGALAWIVFHAEPAWFDKVAIVGSLHGDWWKLFTSEFAYLKGIYGFVALVVLALFGWLFERRHGPAAVLALFFGAGVAGALVELAVYRVPVVGGPNAPALALLAAWAAPDLRAARAGEYYEGDLLGAGALAALLLAMPFGLPLVSILISGASTGVITTESAIAAVTTEASWVAGVVGAVLGLIVGLGIDRGSQARG